MINNLLQAMFLFSLPIVCGQREKNNTQAQKSVKLALKFIKNRKYMSVDVGILHISQISNSLIVLLLQVCYFSTRALLETHLISTVSSAAVDIWPGGFQCLIFSGHQVSLVTALRRLGNYYLLLSETRRKNKHSSEQQALSGRHTLDIVNFLAQ